MRFKYRGDFLMKNFYDKIQAISRLLPNDKRIKNKLLLSCGIYYYLKMKVPFRKLPETKTYNWSSYRHWLQRLKRLGKLQEIENIVGGD